jgi:hypothetical protein
MEIYAPYVAIVITRHLNVITIHYLYHIRISARVGIGNVSTVIWYLLIQKRRRSISVNGKCTAGHVVCICALVMVFSLMVESARDAKTADRRNNPAGQQPT